MIRILKLVAVAALAWGFWSAYSHGRTVRPPDGVLVEDAPRQHNYVDDKPPIRHGAYTLIPRAHYAITGRVLVRERYTDDWFAEVSPLDLSMGWQDMSDNATLANFTFTEHERHFYMHPLNNSIKDYNWVLAESSNNHLIPEDGDVESQLMAIRAGNVVELEGELVDVFGPGLEAHTSMLRMDVGDGACEILLVRRVKIKY